MFLQLFMCLNHNTWSHIQTLLKKKKKKKHSDIISDVDWLRADGQMIVCLSRAISGGTEHASRGAICAAYDVCK